MSKADSADVSDQSDESSTDNALVYSMLDWCQKIQDASGFFLGTFGLPVM